MAARSKRPRTRALSVLAAIALTLGGLGAAAPAHAQAACADRMASCGETLPQRCLLRLGAGAIAADGGSEAAACDAAIAAYRDCLSTLAATCPPESPAAQETRPPRAQLTALGQDWTPEGYRAAAIAADTEALDLYHRAGFLDAPARACPVVLDLASGRIPGAAARTLDALPPGFLATFPCKSALREPIARAQARIGRGGFFAPAPPLLALMLDACVSHRLTLTPDCRETTAPAALATRASLRALVTPRRRTLEDTAALLRDPDRRVEICVAFFVGDARIDPDRFDVALAAYALGMGVSVYGSTADLTRHSFRARQRGEDGGIRAFCESRDTDDRAARALANVAAALSGLDAFEALGR